MNKIIKNIFIILFFFLILLVVKLLTNDYFVNINNKALYESDLIIKEAYDILVNNYKYSFELRFIKIIKRTTTHYPTPITIRGIYEFEIKSEGFTDKLFITWESITEGELKIITIEKTNNNRKTDILYPGRSVRILENP